MPEFPRFPGQDVVASRGRLGLDTLRPDPLEPYLELIFVHSLLGDSRLTWTHGNDGATFWPEWLREDANFSKTRIHTYGYEEPPVHGHVEVTRLSDLGEELCHALESNEDVKSNIHVRTVVLALLQLSKPAKRAQNPIVFVAHSLGGLLVKAVSVISGSDEMTLTMRRRSCTLGKTFTCSSWAVGSILSFSSRHPTGMLETTTCSAAS